MLPKLMESYSPCLSTDLTRLMVKNGLSEAAARQRISRGFSEMSKLTYLSFPKKAKFVYLQKEYDSPKYWARLEQVILESNSSYADALAALIQRDGIMPRSHFLISCGAPILQKKQVSAENILQRFKDSRIVEEINVPGVGDCIILSSSFERGERDVARLRARVITESILLDAVKMWAKRLNLVSYNKVALRTGATLPRVGTFAWDLTAPSYLYPLLKKGTKKPAPGFVVCDILLGFEISEQGIQAFLTKCKTLRSFGNIAPTLQLFIANRYSDTAFKTAKSAGIIPATPETLFGTEVAEGLNQLMSVLTQTAIDVSDPAALIQLFEKLGKIEGASTHLRGALFEFVVAQLIRLTYNPQIEMNAIFTTENGDGVEADIVAVQAKQVVKFVECKGYNPLYEIPDEEVEHWLNVQVPRLWLASQQQSGWKAVPVQFELWTTGKLSDKSIALLERKKSQTRKYYINYLNADDVRGYAKSTNDHKLTKLLNEHFLGYTI